ncbi:MAG TPA: M56 family metallopeptidase, partial [Acidobacteriaceae bacterium]
VLAHEYSHVCQRDFYLQLAAAVHAAIFWFSPLGWWLKRKLSDLGEALSDRAALAQAEDAASYAQILLEFAAAPHRAPLAGVAMARTSNLSSRIDRILNDRRLHLAFRGGRRHAIMVALLVPVALVATIAGFRITPAVHAASSNTSTASVISTHPFARAADVSCDQGLSVALVQPLSSEKLQGSNAVATTVIGGELAQAAPVATPAPAVAPTPSPAPSPEAIAPVAPKPPRDFEEDSDDDNQSRGNHNRARTITHDGDDDDSFSIVHHHGDGSVNWNGEYSDRILKAQKGKNLPDDYIWFERDGKSYIITDPAVIAQADAMFRQDPALERQEKAIEEKQKVLEKQMEEFNPEKAKIKVDNPEFKRRMDELNVQIAKLQSEEFKRNMAELNKQINQEVLAKLQEQMGSIQEQIGEIQGQIGEQMGKFGEQQGELGEQMGRLGEEMGRIGEEQGRRAEEASRKMQSVLDQALRNGKAKPVE